MTRPTIDKDRKYVFGYITQECRKCDWRGERLEVELDKCPDCDSLLDKRGMKLSFGGLVVECIGNNRFVLTNRGDRIGGYIDEADLSDTIAFLVKNSDIWLEN